MPEPTVAQDAQERLAQVRGSYPVSVVLTLRDHFAAAYLAGRAANSVQFLQPTAMAEAAYEFADAMVKARMK